MALKDILAYFGIKKEAIAQATVDGLPIDKIVYGGDVPDTSDNVVGGTYPRPKGMNDVDNCKKYSRVAGLQAVSNDYIPG